MLITFDLLVAFKIIVCCMAGLSVCVFGWCVHNELKLETKNKSLILGCVYLILTYVLCCLGMWV